MKRVFICSPFRNDDCLKQIENKQLAKEYCRFACINGCAPFAPHVFYTEFLYDCIAEERDIGRECGLKFLVPCDEIWVFADLNKDISEGMKHEIEYSKIQNPERVIRYFTKSMVERKYEDGEESCQYSHQQ